MGQDYLKSGRKVFAYLIFVSGNVDETCKDIFDYRHGNMKWLDFKRKYSISQTKTNFEGSLRRAYRQMELSTSKLDNKRAIQLKQSYLKGIVVIPPTPPKPLREWNISIAKKYNPEFQDEKHSNLPMKNYGGIGFYVHLSNEGVKIEDFIKNIVNYISNALNLIIDIRSFFNISKNKPNCLYSSKDYTNDGNTPICIRIRMFIEEKYSGIIKCCSSGYVDIGNYISDVYKIFKKYYEESIDVKQKYKDNPEFWRVIYLCIDTHLVDSNNFSKELGQKMSYYGCYA